MALPQERFYTIEDIYALPDGERAELIDGKIYYMAPPSGNHQEIVQFLCKDIGNYIDKKKGPCKVFPAPYAVFLNEDDSTYVEPDISVICEREKRTPKGCIGAPDWIIEIVSPSSKTMDYYTKLIKYRDAGVREYWIVNPMKKTITVYDLKNSEAPVIYHFTDTVQVGIYEDLAIDFSQLDLDE
jgi:Uma2 family endonuclease